MDQKQRVQDEKSEWNDEAVECGAGCKQVSKLPKYAKNMSVTKTKGCQIAFLKFILLLKCECGMYFQLKMEGSSSIEILYFYNFIMKSCLVQCPLHSEAQQILNIYVLINYYLSNRKIESRKYGRMKNVNSGYNKKNKNYYLYVLILQYIISFLFPMFLFFSVLFFT